MRTSYLLSLPLFLFTSCATITRGVHEKLSVLSEPSGANVMLSSGEKGVTPAKFVKSRRGDSFTVTVSKPGYIPQSVKVESEASATGGAAMAGNAVLGGLIGIGVDAASGAYNSLYPNPVSVHLVPRGKSAATEENSAERVSRKETAQTKPKPSPSPRDKAGISDSQVGPRQTRIRLQPLRYKRKICRCKRLHIWQQSKRSVDR